MRRLPALPAVACCLALTACGGDDEGDRAGDRAAPPTATAQPRATPTPSAAPRGRSPLELPPGVPTTPLRGRTSAEDRRVIDAWATALLRGDVVKAASYFADPSKVQNGTPVIELDSREDRVAFNLALPCGAEPVAYGSGDGYSIVEFSLRDRPGGDCGGATGQKARCAIKVDGGRITEWYRLADGAAAPGERPPAIVPGTTNEA